MPAERLKERLFNEYPIPEALSIWREVDSASNCDIDLLIQQVVDDLDVDIDIYESMDATGLYTQMPKGTRAITACKLKTQFQGNRYVKWNYDKIDNTCICMYIPAVIYYKRSITIEDLDTLKGAKFQYIKNECLIRMAKKEYSYLSVVKLGSDAGQIDTNVLTTFIADMGKKQDDMKKDIMLYSNG